MKRVVDILAAVLAFTGLVTSFYLILDHYGFVQNQSTLLAEACPLAGGPCSLVDKHQTSQLLGLPYSIIGAAYFSVLLVVSLLKLHLGKWIYPRALTVFLLGGLLFSIYLIYTMYVVIGAVCPYCMTAHIANILYTILFAVSVSRETYNAARHTTMGVYQQ